MARCMLKAWIVFGSTVLERDDHMFQVWKLIKLMKDQGGLPEEPLLDSNAPTAFDTVLREGIDPDLPPSAGTALPQTPHHERLLGAAAPGVPASIHEQMRALVARGALPNTTTAARTRNKFTSGTTYGVPPFYADARKFGYLHPNLPAPTGYHWRIKDGSTWVLSHKRGLVTGSQLLSRSTDTPPYAIETTYSTRFSVSGIMSQCNCTEASGITSASIHSLVLMLASLNVLDRVLPMPTSAVHVVWSKVARRNPRGHRDFHRRYGNLLSKYYDVLEELPVEALPPVAPLGQHTYTLWKHDEPSTRVRVDLRKRKFICSLADLREFPFSFDGPCGIGGAFALASEKAGWRFCGGEYSYAPFSRARVRAADRGSRLALALQDREHK
eukprot:3602469-Amphidinium_carterae.1